MSTSSSAPLWYPEFEELLDRLLPAFCPEWRLPGPPANVADKRDLLLKWRCNRKRSALGAALRYDPAKVRANRDVLIHLAVHDLNPSFNRFLISPIIAAIGYREIHEAIIGYLENRYVCRTTRSDEVVVHGPAGSEL